MYNSQQVKTTISQSIQTASNMAKYDAACKCLLAEKIVLAWIMKNCMEEYADCSIQEIADKYILGVPQIGEVPLLPDETNTSKIQGTGVEDVTITEGTITFDIHYHAILPGTEEIVGLIVNAEAQNDFYPGYPLIKRAIYYCSRMISSQYGTEFKKSHYEKIKKVYSVWLCLHPPKFHQNSITKYQITESCLYGNSTEAKQNYDLMTVIMICLGKRKNKGGNRLLNLLNVLFSTEIEINLKKQVLRDEFQIPMEEKMERRLDDMCNFSKGVWDEAIEKGMAQGLEQGMAQGLEQGVLSAIQNLMESMGWSADQAMEALKIPSGKKLEYTAKL